MFRRPLWHVTSDRRVLIVRGEFTQGIAAAVEQSLAAEGGLTTGGVEEGLGVLEAAVRRSGASR
jgi:hypothetical protein